MTLGVSHTRPVPDGAGRAVAARRRVLADHAGTLAGVIAAAEAVVADETPPLSDSTALSTALAAELRARTLEGPLLSALDDAVEAAGATLPHSPVPEPPYLAVTSRGPVLRATLDAGRLVVLVGVFAVQRGDSSDDTAEVQYVRTSDEPTDIVTVEFHGEDGVEVAEPEAVDGTDGGPR